MGPDLGGRKYFRLRYRIPARWCDIPELSTNITKNDWREECTTRLEGAIADGRHDVKTIRPLACVSERCPLSQLSKGLFIPR